MRGFAPLLLLALLSGCEEATQTQVAPAQVELLVEHEALSSSGEVVTDLGYRVSLDRWIAVTASIELKPCDSSASLGWRLVGGTASAHVTPTETRAGGTAQPRDLLGDGTAIRFGTLTPPAGAYCQVRYASSPADADIEGSAAAPLLGKSMVIAGRYTAPGASDAVPFSYATTLGTRVDLPELSAPADQPLFRIEPGQEIAITLKLHPEVMLDGIEFARMGPQQVESQLVFNLRRGVELQLTPSR